MTINDSWGYNSADHNWKSSETLIRNLIDVASKGGNYLLNVAPNALGEVPAPCIERLQAIGDWLLVNGEAIYGTTAGPFEHQLHWARFTQKPGKLYTHVFSGRRMVSSIYLCQVLLPKLIFYQNPVSHCLFHHPHQGYN